MVKCRDVNDYHHAKDAYLNIVVGNIFHTRFTQRPSDIFASESVNVQYYTDNNTGLLQNRIQRFDPSLKREITAWIPGKSIQIVRDNMRSNRIQFTRYTFENKGGFYDQMPWKASYCKNDKIPLKFSNACFLDCSKYGGYSGNGIAYYILVDYIEKKKHVRAFWHVPVRLASIVSRNPDCLLDYCRKPKPFGLGLKEPKVLL